MKNFFCIPFAALLLFSPVLELPASTQKFERETKILSANPWKQSGFTVSPALTNAEGEVIEDLHNRQDKETDNSMLKFTADGTFYVVLGKSITGEDMMFAARSGKSMTKSKVEEDEELEEVTESTTSDVLEFGSWSFNADGNLVLMTNNGRMKENIMKVEEISANEIIISFKREIGGTLHTFTQTLEAQPFVDLGW